MFTEQDKCEILARFSMLSAKEQGDVLWKINQILLNNRDELDEEIEAMALQYHHEWRSYHEKRF